MPPGPPARRLVALDAFRGAAVAAMILVNNPGSWDDIYPVLKHAGWNGWTLSDLVFPSFLWISGAALTISFQQRLDHGTPRRALVRRAARRAILIFSAGVLLSGYPHFRWTDWRLTGVLQRIAICYFIAAVIYLYTSLRGTLACLLALFTLHWMLLTLVPVPGFGPGVLTPEGNFASWVDRLLPSGPGGAPNPEGWIATLPAIASVLLGALAARLLPGTTRLALASAAAILLGLALSPWMPINKTLWTTTYSLFTAGIATAAFTALYSLIDVRHHRRWAHPLVVFGTNALAIYVFSELAAGALEVTGAADPLYGDVLEQIASPKTASLLYAGVFVAVCYSVAWLLHRRSIVLRF